MLKEHEILGTICLIEPGAMETIGEVIVDFDPKLVIELGTYRGGFTKHLFLLCPKAKIYSFDAVWQMSKLDEEWFRNNGKGNIDFIITQDIYKGNSLLYQLLALNIKKLLFCDNGDKEIEIRNYASCLHAEDLLGVHDFESEVAEERIKHILQEFEEHPANKSFRSSTSEIRFWQKKNYNRAIKLPNDYKLNE